MSMSSLKQRAMIQGLLAVVASVGGVAAAVALINVWMVRSTNDVLYTQVSSVPVKQTALVLGAKVHAGGELSSILHDRAQVAVELYQDHKVSKILVSGDHGRDNYDEVNAVKTYLLAQGVPAEDIFLDHAGFDTYDSLYRARDIFQVESLIIVTQQFHLNRSLFLAQHLQIEAIGITADRQHYWGMERTILREKLARVKAFLDLFLHSTPTYLGETIPITGDSQKSWD